MSNTVQNEMEELVVDNPIVPKAEKQGTSTPTTTIPNVNDFPYSNIISAVKRMLISMFVFTGIMSLIMYLILTFVFVSIAQNNHNKIKDEAFAEITRARGELLEQIMGERDQVQHLQQAMMVYSDSMEDFNKRLITLETKIAIKPKSAVNVIIPAKQSVNTDSVIVTTSNGETKTVEAPPVKKKSFWSKLAFWK